MLDTTGKSWHPSLIPDLIGKAFNILSLSMMLAEGLQCMTFIMLECFFLCPFYWEFYYKFVSCQMLFLHLLRWLYDFYILLMWFIMLIYLWMLNYPFTLEWIQLDHCIWSFECIAVFLLLLFCWGFLHQILAYNFHFLSCSCLLLVLG